jgi:type VI secretion system secreted protein Hcp
MRRLLLAIFAALVSVAAQAAPGDIFLLQVPNINGGVTRQGYTGWIGLISFSAGFTSPLDLSTGQASGKLTCNEVMAIKPLDATSPELALAVVTGHVYHAISLAALGGGSQHEFLRLTLKNAVITSLTMGGNTSSAARTESVAIAAQQIEITSTPQLPDGSPGQPVSTIVSCNGGGG